MKTFIIEREYFPKGTRGTCTHDIFQVLTIERPNTGENSCIEEGWYIAEKYYSPANKCIVWLLKDIPGRSMIEFHIANWPHQLLGCISPGEMKQTAPNGEPGVMQSTIAFNRFMEYTAEDEQIAFHITSKG